MKAVELQSFSTDRRVVEHPRPQAGPDEVIAPSSIIRLTPVVEARFGMDEVARAYVRAQSGESFGKVLVTL